MGFLVSIHTYKFDSEWNYRVIILILEIQKEMKFLTMIKYE